jgi:diacylglycerol kinase (ATP)
MRVEVIVNANAAAFADDPGLAGAVMRAASGARVHVTSSVGELASAARAAADGDAERVVLCGGDGSLMAGVTALAAAFEADRLPEVVPAPGGTVATVARNFGQRASLLETVRRAAGGRELRSALRPTLRVVEPSGETRIGFIFGTGLVARFFDRYYATGAGGYSAAARIVARVFVGSFVADRYSRSVLDPLPCALEVEGRELPPRAYSLLVCSVVRDLGLHMHVTHRAGEDPARPHLVASPLEPRRLGPQVFRVLAGRRLRGAGNFDDLVAGFRVTFPAPGGPYVFDGDLFHAASVDVAAGPRVRIAVA